MTEEYKNNLIKYLVGKLSDEKGINAPQLKENQVIRNNFETMLMLKYGVGNYQIIGSCKSKTTNEFMVYGNTSNNRGWIMLFLNNGKDLKLIEQYNTGAIFKSFISINVDENGLFYGIDKYDNQKNDFRILLMNNFFASKDNEVVLRNSYLVPSTYNGIIYSSNSIQKAIGEATYFLVGRSEIISEARYAYSLLTFTINVGSSNEWKYYLDVARFRYATDMEFDYINYKNGDNFNLDIIWNREAQYGDDIYISHFNGSSFSDNKITMDKIYEIKTIKIVNNNYFYFCNNQGIYVYENGEVTEIYKNEHEGASNINITVNGNVVAGINEVINPGSYDIYVGIYNGNIYSEKKINIQDTVTPNSIFMLNNDFNLYNIMLQISDNLYNVVSILNGLYDGEAFINNYSLSPKSGIIEDENENIIFARNLYNKVIQNNITESTIEIPNTFLNNINLTYKKLLSQNNNNLVIETSTTMKNIYERLLLNYFNKINMTNENDPSNIIINNIGASRLNDSVSDKCDYTDTKMKKYRINYDDETTKIINIGDDDIIELETNNYQYNLTINVDKQINSIELISNDEETIYLIIDTLELEIGKIYNIKQKVKIV